MADGFLVIKKIAAVVTCVARLNIHFSYLTTTQNLRKDDRHHQVLFRISASYDERDGW